MKLSPAQLAALAAAQRGATESHKVAARVLHSLDRQEGRTAAQLSAELARHGIQLSPETVRKLRYVARLLAALDREGLDPERLRMVTDLELLYRVMRAAELTRQSPDVLLDTLERDNPADPRAYLQAIIKTKNAQATPESLETWRSPSLPKVPLSKANELTKAFARFTKARNLTPLLAVEALTAHLDAPPSKFREAVLVWAQRVDVEPDEAELRLAAVLAGLPRDAWHRLMALCPAG